MGWRVRAIRGATTVAENTEGAIAEAVIELLEELERLNPGVLDPDEIVNLIFSVTPDLDAVFPAKIVRQRPGWNDVPLLDVQQMAVKGSLPRCIRLMLQINLPAEVCVRHAYLRDAAELRPDWQYAPMTLQ